MPRRFPRAGRFTYASGSDDTLIEYRKPIILKIEHIKIMSLLKDLEHINSAQRVIIVCLFLLLLPGLQCSLFVSHNFYQIGILQALVSAAVKSVSIGLVSGVLFVLSFVLNGKGSFDDESNLALGIVGPLLIMALVSTITLLYCFGSGATITSYNFWSLIATCAIFFPGGLCIRIWLEKTIRKAVRHK